MLDPQTYRFNNFGWFAGPPNLGNHHVFACKLFILVNTSHPWQCLPRVHKRYINHYVSIYLPTCVSIHPYSLFPLSTKIHPVYSNSYQIIESNIHYLIQESKFSSESDGTKRSNVVICCHASSCRCWHSVLRDDRTRCGPDIVCSCESCRQPRAVWCEQWESQPPVCRNLQNLRKLLVDRWSSARKCASPRWYRPWKVRFLSTRPHVKRLAPQEHALFPFQDVSADHRIPIGTDGFCAFFSTYISFSGG